MEQNQSLTTINQNGLEIIIRYPTQSDALEMMNYINTLSDERTFITYQGEHETLESETKFLQEKLKNIEDKTAVFLLAIVKDQIIGNTFIGMGRKTSKHIGTLGISVKKEFRGQGIGKILMEIVIAEAIKQIPTLEIITLEVYSKNQVALQLYKDLGFIEYGNLPKGVKRENDYDDAIFMYKKIK